jgi:hypothetical protein
VPDEFVEDIRLRQEMLLAAGANPGLQHDLHASTLGNLPDERLSERYSDDDWAPSALFSLFDNPHSSKIHSRGI